VTGPADPDPGVTFDGSIVDGVTTGIVRERPGIAAATASRATRLPTQTATVATWR
jgi:hypothetical protein